MSSYRSSYTSYKSSLPSSTYKSGSSTSSYSPRDEISSSTSRYPSTAYSSPTAYRPSFSGGTYRVKRETPVAPAPTYVSRYTPISTTCSSSSNTLSKADSTTGSGLGDLYSMKPSSQLKRYGSTCSSLGKYSREPSPAALEHTNRIRSRDPSPVMRSIRAASRDPSPGLDSKYKLGNYGSGNSYRMNMPKAAATTPSSPYNARYGAARTPSSSSLGEKSSLYGGGGVGGGVGSSATRTPSCTSLAEKSSTSYGMAASKRTPSSTSLADKTTSYGNSSTKRTPSSSSLADKSSAYGSASARRTPSSTSLTEKSSAYSSSSTKHSQSPTPKGDRTPAYNPSSPSSTRKAQPSVRRTPSSTSISEKSSSERTSSDHQQPARCLSKPKMFQPSEKEKEIAKPNETPPTPQLPAIVIHEEENQLEESDTTEEDESDTSEDDELEEPAELFLAVSVCNRGTSPNPPGNRAMNMQTKNAADIAGTVEKTILRSTKKRKMLEKEMQSERVDDASKYTKYAYNSRLSPLSPRSDRYSPSNLRYSSSPLSSTPSKSSSLSTNEDSRREDSTTSSGSPVRSPKSPLPKSKLSPPRAGRLKSRQSSMESLSPNKPPMGPKGESPLKLSSPNASSLCLGGSKIPNKDFRKSSLNVGPTERTARKSRTPSTGNDSDFNTIEALNGALQAIQRLERSPSAGSEVSNASSRSLRSRNLNESKLRQRCLGKPLGSRTPPSPLSRQNSGTNLKQRTPMIASPLAARSTKIMVAPVTSSSSGNDSSGEIKKTHKKVAKKKMAKEVANSVSSTSCSISLSSSSSGGGGGGGGGNNDSDNQSSNAAKRQLPQPKVVVVAPSTTPVTATPSTTTTLESVKASKKSESSALKKSSSNSLRPDKDPLRRLKKLSSVSNFFVTQQKVTNSDDQIYLESTETSGGGSSSAGGGAEGGADGGGGATSTSTDLDLPSSKSSSKKSISLTRANETKTSKLAKPSNCSTSASNSNSPVHFAKSSTASEPHLSSATTKTSSKSSKTSASKSKTKSKSRSASVNASSTTSGSHNDSAEMPTDQRTESVSPYLATTTATTTTTNVTTSTGGTDSEEASWWQDTSQQIDTSSALDCSFKDEMRFKVRHVDSGETAWWLRNDDNEAEEVEEEENDITTDVFDENGVNTNDPTTNYRKDIALSELDYKAQEGCYYEESAQDTIDGEVRQFPRSHLTPETDWWNDDNGEGEQEEQTSAEQEYAIATAPPKQTQTIQLKICRVESGEIPWWQQQEEEEEEAENQQDISQPEGEAAEEDDQVITFEAQRPQDTTEPSSTASSSADHNKKWWLSGPSKKLFSIPRVESGEKAWWQVDNSDKESKRSKSQDPVQQQQQQTTEQTPPPPQVANPQNTRFQMPRVESGEKAWWLAESSDKDEKRSKSREPERWKDSRSPSSRQSQSPIKKLFNLTRVDADHEEEAWWQSEPNERGKTRSRSRDSDQWSNGRHRSRPDQRQHSSTPPAEHAKQPMWFESPRSSESPVKRVFTQQQSLEEQKERWLEERNRQYQQEQAAQEVYRQSQQIHATDNQKQWPELPSQRSHEYEEEPEEEEEEEEEEESHHHHQPQTSFMPSNRADSQTELSNSFNFEYSERPPPLGQCASPVQNEEEVVAAATAATRREPYCSSPYDNIPMTKVQQQTMAMGSTASVATTNLMPILGATTPPPAPPTNNTKPAHLAYNNNNNANNASHIYQQEHLNQQQQQQQQQQNSTSPPLVHQQHYYSTPSPPHTSTQQRPQPQPAQYNNNELRATNGKLFISRHQNIDELLSGSCRPLSPLFFENDNGSFQTMPTQRNMFLGEITPDQVRIHDSTAQMPHIQRMDSRDEWDRDTQRTSNARTPPRFEQKTIDDAAIQVYKDGDYGAYLDLESSLAEQAEEIEGLNSSRKNSLVVRTQLSVRVHAIIEKLLSAEGSDLRRALFSLKQVFQEDKDLVHAFVALGGLNCLVRVGNGADQNYQNYILRALGQVMLYVDGMNGVMKHEPTMQWLYSLIASNYRSVVKTALKLLLVFVEYAESNCHVLVSAIHSVDKQQGTLPWSNIMRLLKDYDNADAELVIYAASLINKTLGGLNDQDSFYDESDLLEQQGMESVIQHYMSKTGTDIDLINQLQLYEAVLKFEDGESDGLRLPDNTLRKTQRFRNSTDTAERRKSRRHSTGTSPGNINKVLPTAARLTPNQPALDEDSSSSTNSAEFGNGVFADKNHRDAAGVTPGLRRRRERAERHRSFLKEQQEAAAAAVAAANGYLNGLEKREELESESEDRKRLPQLKRDHTVKDLTQKLSNLPTSPTHEDKLQTRIVGDMSGLISKAKEGLAKSKSKGEVSRASSVDQEIKKPEPKKSENELQWEEVVRNMVRPLQLCDLDFTDLNSDDEKDILAPRGIGRGVPPPPPPMGGVALPPPMMPTHIVLPPPMMSQSNTSNGSAGFGSSLTNSLNSSLNGSINGDTIKKNKKTVKLFWKEVREDLIPVAVGKTIWDELPAANVDTQKLEHLFESRAKDLMTKEKQQEMNKSKEVIVLDHKRSNAINIAMTKLPPPRAIKAAILKMDATVVTREGIDKLLNMLPTEEEKGKIQEAQMANPELPLGSAEQFLLTLASISELAARLRLWAFRLDFDNSEKEIAEPLMDLKHGIEILRNNPTFKCILSTLLSVGIFLNGAPVKGFQIEYLAKVPEVKDTVHKHSLLHHLCHIVMESGMETTDLYSEIGPITRASKADFNDLAYNLSQLENECKASWDRLKLMCKHDCPPQLQQKLVDFLADCAERIIILQIVHRRVMNRYRKFLLWLGVPQHSVADSRPNEFCRILSEFALEYRTTRERVQQQIEKKANHRERNKTRGKLIVDIAKFKTKEDKQDAELKELLGTPSADSADGTLTWRRRRAENLRSPQMRQSEENFTDGDDEILESLVKTATKAPGNRTTPRERKRTRHADRKSLRRTLKNGLTEEEKLQVAALIKTY
ncbi:uncharacterized protein LOC106092475 isoform X5 [Stomoxys calcitrans]|uniref:uncharacterized protein LOC106092475 isoform X5 n=1 Tax=Stomoxys calcitrans TaxID=35570 RepID=UPI0027E32E78|nr:uncharacterized protein LOC106092475 isoform X5 [Stomoxys calcitrans]